jgi:hypothetical protein
MLAREGAMPMPPLVAVAVAGAALWVGYKWLAKGAERAAQAIARAEEELRRRREADMEGDVSYGGSVDVKELPVLEKDPETGVYKVRPKGQG